MLSFSLCHSAKCSVCTVSTAELCELPATCVSAVFENYSGRNKSLIASVLLTIEVHACSGIDLSGLTILFIDSFIPIT